MKTEIRKIITDQINRHVAMDDTHRAWLADDIATRVESQVGSILGFVKECANDSDDRVSPGLKSKAIEVLARVTHQ